MTIDIDTSISYMVKDLEPKEYYILRRDLRKTDKDKLIYRIYQRGPTPYKATTYFGTPVLSLPSERCYKVKLRD